jgi:hypothetical protein
MSLEQELRSVQVEWPETPTLRPQLERRRSWRRPLLVAVALVALAVGIAFAVPPARSAILRFFDLGGVTVERVDTLPDATAKSLEAGLGPERSLNDAARVAGFTPVLPPGIEVSRAYARLGVIAIPLGGGRLLTELSSTDLGISKKYAGAATRIEPVQVNGHDGIWLEGGAHVVVYLAPDGSTIAKTLRLAGNTLVWQIGARVYRIEGPLTQEQALGLAESIKPRRL